MKSALESLIEELEAEFEAGRKTELDTFVESQEKGTWTSRQANTTPERAQTGTTPEAGETAWPPESLEAGLRFGQSHARLFPLIGKRVWTPAATGTLLSAFADQCEILPDGATKTVHVRTEDVVPLPIQ